MKTPTRELHDKGQSIWLDNITREMLDSGQIQRYIDDYNITGLTSNPSIFDAAITTGAYDKTIAALSVGDRSSEEIFFELAIEDLRRAADLFAPIHQRTDGVDGWVSLEVSPLLAYDTQKTINAAKTIHATVDRPNLFMKIPGTPEGLPAIEECIASGVPINVTLLFDVDQYRAAIDAYLRGVERRIQAGLNPAIQSVASLFISRWDASIAASVPSELQNGLGLAIGHEVYRAYCEITESDRFLQAANCGARMQRLLWASTKTKDPKASDTLYVHGLIAPFTVNTMPDGTLEAFANHGLSGDVLPRDGGDYVEQLKLFNAAGVDTKALGLKLQLEGARSFVDAWTDLIEKIDAQRSPHK
jgi:transaldolase